MPAEKPGVGCGVGCGVGVENWGWGWVWVKCGRACGFEQAGVWLAISRHVFAPIVGRNIWSSRCGSIPIQRRSVSVGGQKAVRRNGAVRVRLGGSTKTAINLDTAIMCRTTQPSTFALQTERVPVNFKVTGGMACRRPTPSPNSSSTAV